MAQRDNFIATYFLHEYRSPPVPLVALIGCPELHKPLSDFFLHSLKPPLVSLCCTEAVEQFVPRAFPAPGAWQASRIDPARSKQADFNLGYQA